MKFLCVWSCPKGQGSKIESTRSRVKGRVHALSNAEFLIQITHTHNELRSGGGPARTVASSSVAKYARAPWGWISQTGSTKSVSVGRFSGAWLVGTTGPSGARQQRRIELSGEGSAQQHALGPLCCGSGVSPGSQQQHACAGVTVSATTSLGLTEQSRTLSTPNTAPRIRVGSSARMAMISRDITLLYTYRIVSRSI